MTEAYKSVDTSTVSDADAALWLGHAIAAGGVGLQPAYVQNAQGVGFSGTPAYRNLRAISDGESQNAVDPSSGMGGMGSQAAGTMGSVGAMGVQCNSKVPASTGAVSRTPPPSAMSLLCEVGALSGSAVAWQGLVSAQESGDPVALAQMVKQLQLAMQQAYIQATQMAKAMGYYSLEAMELHRLALLKAQKRGNSQSYNHLKIFVGGLQKTTDDETVKEHFTAFGEVARCDIIRNLDGSSRGFAFVGFTTEEAVDKCLEAKFEHIIDGKWVNVRRKEDEPADSGRNAARAVELAAAQAGVEPSQYLNYLTQLAVVKYGYGKSALDDMARDMNKASCSARSKPY